MEKILLEATKRDVFGKKVNKLREKGLIPSNIFGKNIKSTAITIEGKLLDKAQKQAGSTSLIYLKVNGDKERPVLLQNIQKHPVSGDVLHVDFRQVDLKEKVVANVPLEQTNESPAVKDKVGLLLWVIDEIEVEALPTDLPEKITVDVSSLKEIGQEIYVKNLQVDRSKLQINTGENEVIVKLEPLVSEEVQKEIAEEEAKKAQEAAAAAEAAATTTTPEGQPTTPAGGTPAPKAEPETEKK